MTSDQFRMFMGRMGVAYSDAMTCVKYADDNSKGVDSTHREYLIRFATSLTHWNRIDIQEWVKAH